MMNQEKKKLKNYGSNDLEKNRFPTLEILFRHDYNVVPSGKNFLRFCNIFSKLIHKFT